MWITESPLFAGYSYYFLQAARFALPSLSGLVLEAGGWMLNSPRCRPGQSGTAAGVGGGMSNASLRLDFGLWTPDFRLPYGLRLLRSAYSLSPKLGHSWPEFLCPRKNPRSGGFLLPPPSPPPSSLAAARPPSVGIESPGQFLELCQFGSVSSRRSLDHAIAARRPSICRSATPQNKNRQSQRHQPADGWLGHGQAGGFRNPIQIRREHDAPTTLPTPPAVAFGERIHTGD
jgi:hypothetical protein